MCSHVNMHAASERPLSWQLTVLPIHPAGLPHLSLLCRPYYYSAGAGLFAPGGKLEGVSKWTDLVGKAVAVRPGYYANGPLEVGGRASESGWQLSAARQAHNLRLMAGVPPGSTMVPP